MNFDHETLQVDRETLKNLQITAPDKPSRARLSISSVDSSRSLSISDSPVPLSSDSALKSKAHLRHLACVASDTFSSPDPLSSCSPPGTDDDIDDVDELEPFSDLTSPKLAQNIERFLRDNASLTSSSHSLSNQRQSSRRHHRKLRRGRSQTGSAGLLLLPSESSSKKGSKSSKSGKSMSTSPRQKRIVESESDDNDTDDVASLVSPKASDTSSMPSTTPAMHLRSFSESALHRDIQTTQWPSTDESEHSESNEKGKGNALYRRYVSMKKKYQKQRRISRQFQEAITVIQDDNETELASTESEIRSTLAAQYEITMMRMEQQKLGNALQIEHKLKSMERQNSELAQQNQHLQSQLQQQTQIIQAQQLQHQQIQNMAQTQNIHGLLRRHSSAISAISAMSALTASTTDEVEEPMYSLGQCSTPSEGQSAHTPRMAGNFGFVGNSVGTPRTPRTPRTPKEVVSDMVSDMEMAEKYRRNGKGKRRALSEREIEARLLKSDEEVQRVTGDGLSAWDRFLDLMTPAFCSCAPSTPRQSGKSVKRKVKVVE